jgi:hypothetical protein
LLNVLLLCPEGKSSIGIFLPDYTASHPRRQYSSYSLLRIPQVSRRLTIYHRTVVINHHHHKLKFLLGWNFWTTLFVYFLCLSTKRILYGVDMNEIHHCCCHHSYHHFKSLCNKKSSSSLSLKRLKLEKSYTVCLCIRNVLATEFVKHGHKVHYMGNQFALTEIWGKY